MAVVGVEPEGKRPALGLIVPARVAIIAPHFRRAGIKEHSIEGDAERLARQWRGLRHHLGMQRHRVAITLRANRMGVVPIGKRTRGMIRQTVRRDDALRALAGDDDGRYARRGLGGGRRRDDTGLIDRMIGMGPQAGGRDQQHGKNRTRNGSMEKSHDIDDVPAGGFVTCELQTSIHSAAAGRATRRSPHCTKVPPCKKTRVIAPAASRRMTQ